MASKTVPLPQVRLSSGLRMGSFLEQRLLIKARLPAAVLENELALLTQGGETTEFESERNQAYKNGRV